MQSMLHMESSLPIPPGSAPASESNFANATATEYAAVYARTDSPMQYGDVYGVPGVAIVSGGNGGMGGVGVGVGGYEEGFYAHGVGVNGVAM